MDPDDSCFDSSITSLCKSMKQADISGTRHHSLTLQSRRTSLDRFIPVRRGSDAENSYRRLTSYSDSQNESNITDSARGAVGTSWKGQGMKTRAASCSVDERILAFSPRQTPRSEKETKKDQCLSTPKGNRPKRYLPKYPEKIMAMPNIRDDFYCNLMAWSVCDVVAVADNEDILTMHVGSEVCQEYNAGSQVRCLAWDPTGKLLAMGTETGDIRVWDQDLSVSYCFIYNNADQTNAVVWDENGTVIYGLHNSGLLTVSHFKLQKRKRHKLPLKCGAAGLALHPDNKKLAIGAKDGTVLVWGIAEQEVLSQMQAHTVVTKALAWVPWKSDVLVTSGGRGDGSIKTWDVKNGKLLEKVDTDSQVCSMVISGEYREMITGHGLDHNDILFWSLPHLQLIGRLQHHQGRVLQLCLNDKETTLASLGADEELILWDCFEGAIKPQLRRASCPMSCLSPLTFSLR